MSKQDSKPKQNSDPGHVKEGRFHIINDQSGNGDFNLAPDRKVSGSIPEEQRKIQEGIYATLGTLKYLNTSGAFKQTGQFEEFRKRLRQVAEVGIEGDYVHPGIALSALSQIRDEIAIRVGKSIKISYLKTLGLIALIIASIAALLGGLQPLSLAGYINTSFSLPGALTGYFWVIVGGMVGVWLSVAAKRQTVLFEELPDMLGDRVFEPLIRCVFVLLLSCVFALFIELGILTMMIGSVNLADFSTKGAGAGTTGVAILLGLIAGIGERALSVRILDQAKSALSSDK
ncbi:MAG: hypothetical protein AAGA53_00995 [Pseudomonadota bacterium]